MFNRPFFIAELDFIYPYYNSIGFFLEELGFTKDELLVIHQKISDLIFGGASPIANPSDIKKIDDEDSLKKVKEKEEIKYPIEKLEDIYSFREKLILIIDRLEK